jgi:hypothetical protein
MHIGENTMKISELLEAKIEMCPEACCGKPVTECKCGPDCEHCDCHAKNKMDETTSAGSVAAVAAPMGGMQSRQRKNADGTAKNALDSDTLMAGKKKKAYSKKA